MSNWCIKVLVSSLLLLALGACTDSGGDVEPSPILGAGDDDSSSGSDDGDNAAGTGEYSVATMLTAYVDEIVMPNYMTAGSLAADMADPGGPLGAYCESIESPE
jgi:hypothetical protein